MEAELRSLKSQMDDGTSISTNSYKLGPDEQTKFSGVKCRTLIETVLKNHLETYTYDGVESGAICKNIADDLTTRASKLGFARYKYVCQISMFTNERQTLKAVSRFLWDESNDNYVTSRYDGVNYSVVVTLYAVYFE